MNFINSIKKWRQNKYLIRHQTIEKTLIKAKVTKQMNFWRESNCFKSWRANHKGRIMEINLKHKQRLIYHKFCKINK